MLGLYAARGLTEEQLPKQSGVITVTDSHASSLHDMYTHTYVYTHGIYRQIRQNLTQFKLLLVIISNPFFAFLQVCSMTSSRPYKEVIT